MELNTEKNPILYSVGTYLAYIISRRYYGNVHYVWCTTKFNDLGQPPTLNPCKICRGYLEQIVTGDRHARVIGNNITGILTGAEKKFNVGIIDKGEYNAIKDMVSTADYELFLPVLYITDGRKVKSKCKEVPEADKASDNSVEYVIENLEENEFETIFVRDILSGIVAPADKKAGE